MPAPTHLSFLEHRFAVAVGALDSVERPGIPPQLGLDAAVARPRDAERDRLVSAWARSTTDGERLSLAREAELQALEAFLGPLVPRNAGDKRKPSEQFLAFWRLRALYGTRLAWNDEKVPWMPEEEAKHLLRLYTALAKPWLRAEARDEAIQAGFMKMWLDELRSLVEDADNYELAPPPGPNGPSVAIRGRVMLPEATRRLFAAAKRVQINIDELSGEPTYVDTSVRIQRSDGGLLVAAPRNAEPAKRASEQFVTFWRLVSLYGRRPEVGPNGERFPWTPETDARALARHYAALADKWLKSEKIESALQPGFIKRWRDELLGAAEGDTSYEQPVPPPPPAGPLTAIKERVLKADATRRLFDAAARLQLHFDVLESAPSTIAVWADIATSTVADTAAGVVALPAKAVDVAAKNLKPWLIGGAVVVSVGGAALLFLRRGDHDHR